MSSNNKILFTAIAAVLVFAAFWVGRKQGGLSSRTFEIRSDVPPQLEVPVPAPTSTQSPPSAAAEPAPTVAAPPPRPKKNFQQAMKDMKLPTLKQVRQEVDKDPHTTPDSLIKSALQIGDAFDAVTTEKEGEQFVERMAKCADDKSEQTDAIRATCIQYSQRLAEKYPALKSQASRVEERSSPEARELLQLSEQMLKGRPKPQ